MSSVNTVHDSHQANHTNKKLNSACAGLIAAGVLAFATSTGATGNGTGGTSPVVLPPLPGTATFVDWDLPALDGAGNCPSAIGAITLRPIDTQAPIDPVYYVTLCPQTSPASGRFGPSLVELRTEMHPQPAVWRAWNLGDSPVAPPDPTQPEPAGITGGMRLSTTNRVFVRTQSEILRLDFTTAPVKITRFPDISLVADVAAQSDLALVDRSGGYTDVWSTFNSQTLNPGSPGDSTVIPPIPPSLPVLSPVPPGIVQRLTIANSSQTATVTRYAVDGGAGLHYLSGIVSYQGKMYYSEGDPTTDPTSGRGNSISVLDPNTGDVHRFSLSKVDPLVFGPRQISVDPSTGTLWTVTASGHVVSFKPNSTCGNGLPTTAQMASYMIPGGLAATDPRGVSPSGGTIGFTQGALDPVNGKKVGLLVPNKDTVKVTATVELVSKATFTVRGTTETVVPDMGTVQGVEKPNLPLIQTNIDGKFSQAQLPDTGEFPLGILRDPFTCRKAFYVAVGLGGTTDHRLSRVEFDTNPDPLPVPDLTAPDSARPGLATGGGTLGQDPTAIDTGDLKDLDSWAPGGGQGSFDLVIYRNYNAGPASGRIAFFNKLTGDNVKSTAITSFSVSGNQATFGGTCTNSKTPLLPCTFQVTIKDNGYPGKNTDTFSITGLGFAPNQGTLTGGNVYVHRRNW